METTGLVTDVDRITEIAAIEIYPNYMIKSNYHTLVNPEVEISELIVSKTGITTEMVKDKPKFADVADKVYD